MNDYFSSLFNNLIVPLLVAVFSTQFWNLYLEKGRKEAEREERLYGPVRFYLMLIKHNRETRERLRQNMHDTLKQTGYNLTLPEQNGRRIQFSEKIGGPSVKEWWFYVRRINELLKKFSGLIRKDDRPLVENFTSSLLLRKMVTGEEEYKYTALLFSADMESEARQKLFSAIEALQKKILEE